MLHTLWIFRLLLVPNFAEEHSTLEENMGNCNPEIMMNKRRVCVCRQGNNPKSPKTALNQYWAEQAPSDLEEVPDGSQAEGDPRPP